MEQKLLLAKLLKGLSSIAVCSRMRYSVTSHKPCQAKLSLYLTQALTAIGCFGYRRESNILDVNQVCSNI